MSQLEIGKYDSEDVSLIRYGCHRGKLITIDSSAAAHRGLNSLEQ